MSHDHANDLSPVKRALLEMRAMRARVEELERVRIEPIAIVGVGLRLPGGVASPEDYWKLLLDGTDAIREVPPSRWDADSYHDSDPDAAGKIVTRFGGFLDRVDEFDAAFFGITPREAVSMDPQQRLLLEVAWEALEHAGQAPDQLAGTDAGVFIGLSSNDYLTTELKFVDAADIDPYLATGGHPSVASGRLSYVLGLQGPSLTIDTACSSSLTAVHLAVQSLRLGECGLALAGGVSLMLLPELSVNFSRARMLAPDGRCKSFDARADGYVRSEGCGLIVLKRLSDAMTAGDRVIAVIRGTAVNQDGRSSGLTVPNGPAQEAVIGEALRRARIAPDHVDYIEAHGTGTALGDPVELRALGGVFATGRRQHHPLLVGSVKTNLGHLEAAAGVAGIIKVALALERRVIPPHLHFETPTPHVDWRALALDVPTKATEWARSDHPRTAGVSSFGFSGTNAHVVLSEAPARTGTAVAPNRPAHVLTLSARTDDALRAAAGRLSAFIAANPVRLGDVCHTMNAGRAHFAARAAMVARTPEEARAALDTIAAGGTETAVARGSVRSARRPEVAFLFSGQGYEQPGMGRELFETQPVFRRTLERCDEILRPHDVPLLSLLYGADQARLHEPRYTQPVLFAFGCALAEVWRSWGVEPAFVAGHSLGEDLAACVAGVFTLEQGLAMVAARARLMHSNLPEGAMAAVFASAAEVERLLQGAAIAVSIGAINGPQHVVISGTPDAIAAAVAACERAGLKARAVAVPRACHSSAMDPVLGDIERLAAGMTLTAPRLAIASTVTGRLATATELADPVYWRRHVRETVRFADALQALYDAGARIFVEIGPNGSLSSMGRRMFDSGEIAWLPSLKRDGRDWDHILSTLGDLYVRGVPIDWRAVDAECGFVTLDAPTYPFERQRYWSDAVRPRRAAGGSETAADQAASFHSPWLHELAWRPKALVSATPPSQGTWLIVSDGAPLAAAIVTELGRRGRSCALIPPEVELSDAAQVERALVPHVAGGAAPVAGVVYVPLSPSLGADVTGHDMLRASTRACAGALHVAQALRRRAPAARMWIVTASAVAAGAADRPQQLAHSPLWGWARGLALEHPQSWGGMMDLPPGNPAAYASRVVDELLFGDGEDQIAWRSDTRLVARIMQRPSVAAAGVPIRRDASYLITGGLGRLGSELAKWLIAQGATHLTLLSRRGLDPERQSVVDALRTRGADVEVVAADVSDAGAMRRVFDAFGQSRPPLGGIIHAASAGGAVRVMDLDAKALHDMLSPKVAGTWELGNLARELALDFFVVFSSTAGVLGSAFLSHYGAANAFLDAFAASRRSPALPITAIAWGAWESLDLSSAGLRHATERSGLRLMSIGAGLDAFGHLLHPESPTLMVADADWTTLRDAYETQGSRPFLHEVGSEQRPQDAALVTDGVRQRLVTAPAHERRELVARHVLEIAAQAMRLDARQVDPTQGLFDLGMDSLMALDLRKRLESSLGLTLPTTLLFNYPTIDAIVALLVERLGIAAPVAAVPSTTLPAAMQAARAGTRERGAARSTQSLDDLSEDELADLLAAKLDGQR